MGSPFSPHSASLMARMYSKNSAGVSKKSGFTVVHVFPHVVIKLTASALILIKANANAKNNFFIFINF